MSTLFKGWWVSRGGEPPQVCRFSFCPNRKFAARYPNFAEGSPLGKALGRRPQTAKLPKLTA